ncbi:MAG: nitrile hydratase subunit alpha [Candidatus Dormibacteraeota bacterium]|nr:nitrile hydratase subunit alpha [Candidatus Dormibacteraeota bacterium]
MSEEHHHHEAGDGHGHRPQAPSEVEARALALESLLREKGVVTEEEIDQVVSAYEHDIGPMIGARVVARAWVDQAYRERLLRDAPAAVAELGLGGAPASDLVVVEDTPEVHNLVVCTLCSCYPWAVLGLPPSWYKSPAYRSRAVSEPREVMREFGLELADGVSVNVWDSSSDLRYMVLPQRPAGTEGWNEDELAGLVTRDSMIGVAVPKAPAPAAPR